jgi:RNA-binding protein
MELTGKQKRHLRGLGHALSPVVMLGREGLSAAIMTKTDVELENHELVKIKLGDGCLEEPDEVAAALATRCKAAVAQVIGHTVLLYRRRSKDPTIKLPRATPSRGPTAAG